MSGVYHSENRNSNINLHTKCAVVGNDTHDSRPSLEMQSGRFRFKKPIKAGTVRRGGGRRGRVGICTNASRLRFMQKFASLDFSVLELLGVTFFWVTLTTPREYWDREAYVYGALRRFHDRLDYSQADNGYLGAFVRRELGSLNGALHYHLVIVGGKGINVAWLRTAWGECLRYEGQKLLRVSCEEVADTERIARYMAKYCSKAGYEGKERTVRALDSASPEPESEGTDGASLSEAHNVGNTLNGYTGGRWWYVWGASKLPWGETITVVGLDALQIANRLRRIFRRWRAQVSMRTMDRKQRCPGMACRYFVPKQFSRLDGFVKRLRRDRGGGFTVLMSPDLVELMVDAAAYAQAWHNDRVAMAQETSEGNFVWVG